MSIAAFAKPQVHGPARPSKLALMGIRFVTEPDGGGAGGYTPPADQAALDKLINGATAKVHKKYEGHDDYKAKADRLDTVEAELNALKGKQKPNDDKGKDDDTPTALTPEDVQKQIDEAIAKTRAEERAVSALDRATSALDKALAGRTVEPAKLLTLDRKQFVTKENEVDSEAIKTWVDENSAEGPKPRARDLGQGHRDSTSSGSVQAGKDLFDQRHPSKKTS